MTDAQVDKMTMHSLKILWRTAKWYIFQYVLLFFIPFIWGNHLYTGTSICIAIYTLLYSMYWEFISVKKRLDFIYLPLLPYLITIIPCYLIWKECFPTIVQTILMPLYGAVCFIIGKITKKGVRKKKNTNLKRMIFGFSIVIILIIFKLLSVSWECKEHGSIDGEKKEILQRRDYLVDKLVVSPENVLDEMPSGIGEQFQGEWALYSCSMLSAALVNISWLYPETKEANIGNIDKLIQIVKSPNLRKYDNDRWGEDPLNSMNGNQSHISYLSHLAWMIGGYKSVGGDSKYDELYASICETMNRRILESSSLNLPTYPGEPIYIPDMLVAIVALKQYSVLCGGKYNTTVKEWINRAQHDWIDDKTGLLVSFLNNDGTQLNNASIKGSYSALNTSYLTYIDEPFAKAQYNNLKQYFWKEGLISGFKEYYDRSCPIGLDIDAGPIIFGLSPSGTAFATGAVTYFSDNNIRSQILRTAEKAGHTITWNNKRHYALANVAIVGEAIMLAMRTHYKK